MLQLAAVDSHAGAVCEQRSESAPWHLRGSSPVRRLWLTQNPAAAHVLPRLLQLNTQPEQCLQQGC